MSSSFSLMRLGPAHVGILVDRSGSMRGSEDAVVAGVNQQVRRILDTATEKTLVTVGFFDTTIEYSMVGQEAGKLRPLTRADYNIGGGTSLLDAVDQLLDVMEPEVEKPDNDPPHTGLVVVMTDGDDTSSVRATLDTLGARIARLQRTGRWTFVLLGPAGQIERVASRLNIPAGNVGEYAGARSFGATADAVGRYFAARATGQAQQDHMLSGGPAGALPPKGK